MTLNGGKNMLRALLIVLLMSSTFVSSQAQGNAAKKDDISGDWILTELFPGETHTHRMSLQLAGEKISGQSGGSKIEGVIEASGFTLKWLTNDGRIDATYTGKSQDGTLKGEGDWGGVKLQWS